MFNFIYYPVSGIMWVWHKVFGLIPFLGPDSGITWALSIVFLVFTLRLILYKPFVKQVRTMRQMQEFQPQIKALQKKYANDKQRQALEMQKLQKENGFNPLMGCLPVLLQMPVFLGLFHVLRSFNRTGGYGSRMNMTPYENANTANYFFSVEDVQSFLSARLFGAPLSAYIISPAEFLEALRDYGGVPTTAQIAWVAVPLMLIASVATHFNSRASIARQSPEAAANPQSAIMNRLSLWIFPAGVLVSGAFLPIGILLYWVSNNVWTVFQQYVVYGRIDKEEAEKKVVALEKRAANAPKPGAKPAAPKKAAPKVIAPQPPKAEAAKEGDAAPVRRAPAVKAKKAGGGQQPVRRPAAKKPSSQANKRKRR